MRRAIVCACLLALASAAPAGAALPKHGTLLPGRALGGVRLGETAAQVQSALGASHGVCRGCADPTWYFTYRPFDSHGLGVELTGGRVSGVYTLWQPAGWSTPAGLRLGAFQGEVTSRSGPTVPVACAGYTALVSDSAAARTAYYVLDGKVWGFGLFARGANPCR